MFDIIQVILGYALQNAYPINQMNPKYYSLFSSLNLMLGIGPLILPFPFFQAGIILSSIWIIFIAFLSFNAAQYIAQSLSIISQIHEYQKSTIKQSLLTQSLLKTAQKTSQFTQIELKVQNFIKIPRKKVLDHTDMFQILFGPKFKIIPCFTISIYLIGAAILKCIMTGNILSIVFKGDYLIGDYKFWLGVFFVLGACLSFNSLFKAKLLQISVIIVRFVQFITLFGGAMYIIIFQGVKDMTPQNEGLVNVDNFSAIFSNSIFSFLFHHNLPSLWSQTETKSDQKFFIRTGFIIVVIQLLLVPITGSMAFGNELGKHQYKFYNFDFMQHQKLHFIFQFLVSFYVFLNIASFSVFIGIIRSNILKVSHPKIDSKSLKKPPIILTIILLVIILIVSFQLQEYLQGLLNFTGGIFGSFILFFMPCILVWKARKCRNSYLLKNKSEKISLWMMPVTIMISGILFTCFHVYLIAQKIK